jgi:hypothetical protein
MASVALPLLVCASLLGASAALFACMVAFAFEAACVADLV